HIFARDQGRRRRNQVIVLRWQIAAQIDDAARQYHVRQERKAPRVGLGLTKVKQPDTRRLQQHLAQRGVRCGAEKQAVDSAFKQFHRGRRVLQRTQRQIGRLDTVDRQDLLE